MTPEIRTALYQLMHDDQPLAAWHLAAGLPPDVERDDFLAYGRTHLAHLETPEAYREFYEQKAQQREVPVPDADGFPPLDPRQQHAVAHVLTFGLRRVLDLGCGDGVVACALAKHGCAVTAVDSSPTAIEHTKALAQACHVSLTVMVEDLECVSLGARFDAVLLLDVLEHVRDVDAVLKVADAHVSLPHGAVVITAPASGLSHASAAHAREHVRLLDASWMREILAAPGRQFTHYQRIVQGNVLHQIAAYELELL